MLRFTKRSGTPVYMAPEIYQRNYSYEADVWSVGIMLYQLVTRRFPFWDTFDHCQVLKLEEVSGRGGRSHHGPIKPFAMPRSPSARHQRTVNLI
jgi:serine/threonine protein kinase